MVYKFCIFWQSVILVSRMNYVSDWFSFLFCRFEWKNWHLKIVNWKKTEIKMGGKDQLIYQNGINENEKQINEKYNIDKCIGREHFYFRTWFCTNNQSFIFHARSERNPKKQTLILYGYKNCTRLRSLHLVMILHNEYSSLFVLLWPLIFYTQVFIWNLSILARGLWHY